MNLHKVAVYLSLTIFTAINGNEPKGPFTVFELTIIFKHEMIGFLPKFQRNFELSGTSN